MAENLPRAMIDTSSLPTHLVESTERRSTTAGSSEDDGKGNDINAESDSGEEGIEYLQAFVSGTTHDDIEETKTASDFCHIHAGDEHEGDEESVTEADRHALYHVKSRRKLRKQSSNSASDVDDKAGSRNKEIVVKQKHWVKVEKVSSSGHQSSHSHSILLGNHAHPYSPSSAAHPQRRRSRRRSRESSHRHLLKPSSPLGSTDSNLSQKGDDGADSSEGEGSISQQCPSPSLSVPSQSATLKLDAQASFSHPSQSSRTTIANRVTRSESSQKSPSHSSNMQSPRGSSFSKRRSSRKKKHTHEDDDSGEMSEEYLELAEEKATLKHASEVKSSFSALRDENRSLSPVLRAGSISPLLPISVPAIHPPSIALTESPELVPFPTSSPTLLNAPALSPPLSKTTDANSPSKSPKPRTPVRPRGATGLRSAATTKKATVRVASWNVEWMSALFKPRLPAEFALDNKEFGIYDTNALCLEIAGVISDLNPDVMVIVEGPEHISQMALFVDTYLAGVYNCFGGLDGEHQRVYILVGKHGPVTDPAIDEETMSYLSQPWKFDIEGDLVIRNYKFTRTPLVVKGTVLFGGVTRKVYFIGLHCKSKYVRRGEEKLYSVDVKDNLDFLQKAVKNRKRIAAEWYSLNSLDCHCCIDDLLPLFQLKAPEVFRPVHICIRYSVGLKFLRSRTTDPFVIVAGDLNDGPGMDFFEEYYLLFDSVEALLGSPFYQKKLLQPLLIRKRFVHPDDQYSAEFYDFIDGVAKRKVLIDHICVSRAVYRSVETAGIAHDLVAKHNYMLQQQLTGSNKSNSNARQYRVSDHSPCYADIM